MIKIGRPRMGVMALARELGVSYPTISRKFQRGMTPDEIRAEMEIRKKGTEAQKRKWAGRPKSVKTDVPATLSTPTARTYVSTKGVQAAKAAPAVPTTHKPAVKPTVPIGPTSRLPADDSDLDYPVAGTTEDIFKAQTRRTIAQADAQELKNQQQRGELTPTAQIRSWGTKAFTRVRDRLTRMGEYRDEIALETDPAKVDAILQRIGEQVLGELHGMVELWGTGTQVGTHTQTQEERDGRAA